MSTPLRPSLHAKQRSCRDKTGFYEVLSRNARGRSDSGSYGSSSGDVFCDDGGACGNSSIQEAVGSNASFDKERLINSRVAPEAFPANLEQNPENAAAAATAATTAADTAATFDADAAAVATFTTCLLYTSPSPRD